MTLKAIWRSYSLALALCALSTIAGAQAASTSAPKSTGELSAAVKRGYEHKDVKAILDLVYWDRSGDAGRAQMSRNVSDDFPASIERITFDPLGKDEKVSVTKNGVTYHPTLPPLGRLVVHFAPEAGSSGSDRTTSFLYGSKDGRYFLLTTEPAT